MVWLSTSSLFNVAILLFFAVFIFSVAGHSQFFGRTLTKCRMTEMPINSTYWEIDFSQGLCNPGHSDTCKNGTFCGSPYDYGIPLENDHIFNDKNINFNVVNFNSFGPAMVLVFQSITM